MNPSSREIATDLINTYDIVTAIIMDLSSYSEQANVEWKRGVIHAENINSTEMLGLPLTHRANIYIRLAFIK